MAALINNLINSSWIQYVLKTIYGFNSTEITVLVVITALLLLFMAYRTFGGRAVAVLSIIYIIIYALWVNDIYNLYKTKTTEENMHIQTIEEEIMKNEMPKKTN